jgi:hypothetical protein
MAAAAKATAIQPPHSSFPSRVPVSPTMVNAATENRGMRKAHPSRVVKKFVVRPP